MTDVKQLTRSQREVLNRFSAEMTEAGCDAIVVIGSATVRNKTRSFVSQYGNELLCSSLIQHAFHTETVTYINETEEETEDKDD
jgi:hypothetical protein